MNLGRIASNASFGAFLILIAQSGLALSWVDGSSQTYTYTPGISIGVLYIATDDAFTSGVDSISVVSGTPPAGINWARFGACSSGKLCTAYTGTPTGATTNVVVLRASNGTETADLTLTFIPSFVTSGSIVPTSVVGLAYNTSLSLVGGTSPFTWSVSSGALPSGLTLNSATGAVSGTPTAAGVYSFALRATDSASRIATSSNQTLTVYAALDVTTVSLPATTVGAAYSQTLASSGGTTPKTWTIDSGSLPTGLALNSSSGAITGTSASSGTASFTAKVACCSGAQATEALSIVVNPAPAVTTSSLPDGALGGPFSSTLTSSGGTGAMTWSIAIGALPAGLSMSSGGVISGIPTAVGISAFTVRVTDSVGIAATRALSISVTGTPAITTSSLAAVTVGQSVSVALAASGGTSPYSWSVSAGSLPPGISLPSSGVLAGIPSMSGSFSFTAQVIDAASQTDSKSLTLLVNAAPVISTSTLPLATPGASYSHTLAASGGTGSLSWSISSGALLSGLTLSGGGVISGTPVSGSTSFVVRVIDSVGVEATRNLTLTAANAPSITTTSLASVTVGQSVATSLAASGGTTPFTWSVVAGALPAGITLNTGTGGLSGTPAVNGTSTFSVTVIDANNLAATQSLSWTVYAAPAITTSSLTATTAGASYSAAMAATGGAPPLNWSIASGNLPAGISMNSGTGSIAGTPATAGAASFTVRVTDGNGVQASTNLSITVNPVPAITTSSLPQGVLTVPYSQSLSATGGTGSLTWSVISGNLPPGLSLSPAGALTGTPTASGTSAFTFRVQDSLGIGATQAVSVSIVELPAITTTTLNPVTVTQTVSVALNASNGTSPFSWSITGGSLPAGISLGSSTGTLSGTLITPGSASFAVTVTDSNNLQASRNLTWSVNPAPSISTNSLPSTTSGRPLPATTMTATGGTGSLTWSATGLPPGTSLSTAGDLSGTPAVSGTAAVVFKVVDANAVESTRSINLQVNNAPAITTLQLVRGVVAKAYSQTLSSAGGTGTHQWSIASGFLPPGLALSSGGVVSGAPQSSGSFTFTIQITDTAGASATQAFSVDVFEPLVITTNELSDLTQGQDVSTSLAASGGITPYTWSLAAGSLPSGLSLSSAGTITGRPVTVSRFVFQIKATDANGLEAEKALSWQINPSPSIRAETLRPLTAGRPMPEVALSASGGTGVPTWTAINLPAGLSLSSTGSLSGTPSASGTSSFTVKVTDRNHVEATLDLSLVVNAPPAITISGLMRATAGTSYSQILTASGGTAPLTWRLTGSLPGGLTLNPSTGAISGTPRSSGQFAFTAQVADTFDASDNKALSIEVIDPVTITSFGDNWKEGTVGAFLTGNLRAQGGVPPYMWELADGAMPPGIVLLDTAHGTLGGTPTTQGSFQFSLRVTDKEGSSDSRPFTIHINDRLNITTTNLGPLKVGAPAAVVLSTSGGTPPFAWSVSEGSLPPGISIEAGTGGISGIPTKAGQWPVTIRVVDANQAESYRGLTLDVSSSLSIRTPSNLRPLTIEKESSRLLEVSGGVAPLVWRLSKGSLPPGLALNAATGAIQGVPTEAGSRSFAISVVDAYNDEATQDFTLAVNPAVQILSGPLPDFTAGTPSFRSLEATGGTPPFVWRLIEGKLPLGVTLDSLRASIGGRPAEGGRFPISVSVRDANEAEASTFLELMVNSPIGLAPAEVSDTVEVNSFFEREFPAVGGTGPASWSIVGGPLPSNLFLDPSNGRLSGTPDSVGNWQTSIMAQDANGSQAVATFRLQVYAPLKWETTESLPSAKVRLPYRQPLSATGGVPPLRYRVDGTLPDGLFLDAGTGLINGTPKEGAESHFDVVATDQAGHAITRTFHLNVNRADGFRVQPSALVFFGNRGGPAVAPQLVEITSTPANQSIKVASDSPWLNASFSSVGTPAILRIDAKSDGLEPGEYNGVVTVQGEEIRSVPVSFKVTDEPSTLAADPARLTFSSWVGGGQRQQLLRVAAPGIQAAISASISDPQATWLSFSSNAVSGGTFKTLSWQ